MEDGKWISHDTEATETLGPMCKGCGWRGGKHRPQIGTLKAGCPGEEYDPADVAMFEAAQAAQQN